MIGMRAFLSAVVIVGAVSFCGADEWPKWMGPRGDNISTDAIAGAWPGEGPKKLWGNRIRGMGFRARWALDGKIYLFSQVGTDDTLTAFDAESGKQIWTHAYACGNSAIRPNNKNPGNDRPVVLATPTIDHGQIYTYGAGGDLVCRTIDGAQIWHLNVINALGEKLLDQKRKHRVRW